MINTTQATCTYVCHKVQALSLSNFCPGQAISIKFNECVSVVLVIKCAMHKHCVVLCCVVLCCVVIWHVGLHHIFPHYHLTGTIFGEKNLLDIKYVFWFSAQILSKTFLILKRIQRDIIVMHICLPIKCPPFLSDFNQTWIFRTEFSKSL